MKKTSLVIMAAGLGSRFGGTKQLANIGPNGEAILDYTIHDARAAGIEDTVLIVRTEIASDIETHIESIHGSNHNCIFVCQDDFGPHREKPWGTTHAVLSAQHAIAEDSSFLLANADDYYGPASFELASNQLSLLNPGTGMLITFELAKTLPKSGEVTRGICNVENGRLTQILETTRIGFRSSGEITIGSTNEQLKKDIPVSLNLWGFHGSIMEPLEQLWDQFFSENATAEKAECLLPESIHSLMNDGDLIIKTFSSGEEWTGLTNPEDFEVVQSKIRNLRSL